MSKRKQHHPEFKAKVALEGDGQGEDHGKRDPEPEVRERAHVDDFKYRVVEIQLRPRPSLGCLKRMSRPARRA